MVDQCPNITGIILFIIFNQMEDQNIEMLNDNVFCYMINKFLNSYF